MRKTNFLKTLLVAVGLTAGVSAWATDYTTVWQNTFDDSETYQDGWSSTKSRSSASCNVTQGTRDGDEKYINFSNSAYNTVWTYTLSSVTAISEATDYVFDFDFALTRCNTGGNTILKINSTSSEIFKVSAAGGDTGKGSTTLVTGSVYINGSSDAESETVTMNTFRGGTLTWYNISISSNATNGTDLTLTKCTDATETKTYHISDAFVALGTIVLDPANTNSTIYGGGSFDNFVFKTPKIAGFVAAPTYNITGAYNNSRKFTLACITEGTTIYYAESDIEKGAAGWIEYSTEATTEAETVYAYAKDGDDNTSEKISFATGAGSTLSLNDATITHSAENQYTITNSQSTILGTPTATVHYQIDGGTEKTSTDASVNVAISADGTITYWLTADGYASTTPVDADVYAAQTFVTIETVDLCTSNDNSWATAGDAITISGDDEHTYYKYKDQSENIVSDGLFAATFSNEGSSWRIQRYYGGTKNQNTAESIALIGLTKDQIVQVKSSVAAASTTNLSAIPGNTYTGTQSYIVLADGDVTLRYAKDAIITKVYVCETTVSKTITAAGWATYCSPYALNFSGTIANLTAAYIITGNTGNTLELTPVTTTVAANTGLLLQGSAGTVTIPVAASGTDYSTTNKLVGVTASQTLDAKGGYVLMNGASGVGFYKNSNNFTLGANTAYLPESSVSTAREFFLLGDDTVTSIDEEMSVKNADDADIYDMQGRRVAQPQKGLYIMNGKKVVIK